MSSTSAYDQQSSPRTLDSRNGSTFRGNTDTQNTAHLASLPRSYFRSTPSINLGIDDNLSITTFIDDLDTRSNTKSHRPFDKRSFWIGLGLGALLFTAAATPYFALSTTKAHCDIRVELEADSWMNKCGVVGRSLGGSVGRDVDEVDDDVEVVEPVMDEEVGEEVGEVLRSLGLDEPYTEDEGAS
ncbi:hypothetical protein L202_05085 [Cryptococcus amylolentus CBS 6039]|uniref:Uncharacterized protein n=2 Tax=Cryptococcus amylolentus TaxID=104669 RepID=A0A1E3HQJ7_9TREE|nr:hypothetical protein L202_05085 [Cryptococcus amylolentus CBS 6039]ODN77996.1 hypothetical protein L202_05085 [Cryptococcus amylolentus CBS 6039]ODO05948.1 hypothetical protein I350_05009 [Cryptococcus amylolentus CBS 6273]